MKKSEQSLARISIIFSVHLGILTPKKSFAKNNTNSDLSSGFVLFAYGGAKGSRTPDLLNAIQTRYQLRYNPINFSTLLFYKIFEVLSSKISVFSII